MASPILLIAFPSYLVEHADALIHGAVGRLEAVVQPVRRLVEHALGFQPRREKVPCRPRRLPTSMRLAGA